ncbi:MAG: hypothetical protein GY755_21130 [Chloroflexi bacterium]|nr:hypothetical protein [Chloroflexota bacterium]
MRIWDISPGYLNRASLLGEHRELHGLASIHINNKKGYSRHPETKRWTHYLSALAMRHEQLVTEMIFRGYQHHSPLPVDADTEKWPDYLDAPDTQIEILQEKYLYKEPGRIPLPSTLEKLWEHHRFSVMARDRGKYRLYERKLPNGEFAEFTKELNNFIRQKPLQNNLDNAIEEMWQYLGLKSNANLGLNESFQALQEIVKKEENTKLLHSTALVELAIWIN